MGTNSDFSWVIPTEHPTLEEDEVHVWRASIYLQANQASALINVLDARESDRASRYYFEKDRQTFVVGRGMLRTILGRYLGDEPHFLRFRYNTYGKPAIETNFKDQTLDFNVSHSGSLVLIAVSRNRELGIDVERIRTDIARDEIAERFFSPGDVAALRSFPSEKRFEAFFRCWTRKEAYIKAQGQGLSIPLASIEDLKNPKGSEMGISTRKNEGQWVLREIEPGPGYVGTVIANGPQWRLRLWQWSG